MFKQWSAADYKLWLRHWLLLCAGWQHSEKSVSSPKLQGTAKETVTILHRFHFTSALKRMAALVKVRTAVLSDATRCRSSSRLLEISHAGAQALSLM